MSNLENYQLGHPELLTEDTLHQILRDRCIEVPQLKTTSKTELVEIFKRVALPLPQRKYDNSTYLGRKLIELRKGQGQREAVLPAGTPIPSDVESSSKNNRSSLNQRGQIVDRLKPPLAGIRTESEKIRSSKSITISSTPCDANKRKTEILQPPGCRKRQKITWP